MIGAFYRDWGLASTPCIGGADLYVGPISSNLRESLGRTGRGQDKSKAHHAALAAWWAVGIIVVVGYWILNNPSLWP